MNKVLLKEERSKGINTMRLAILGNGFLAGIVVEAAKKGLLADYELVGVLGRSEDKTKALAEKVNFIIPEKPGRIFSDFA